jgi:hypothetical protein
MGKQSTMFEQFRFAAQPVPDVTTHPGWQGFDRGSNSVAGVAEEHHAHRASA